MQGQLTRAKAVITRGEKLLQALPLRGTQASWAAKLEERKNDIDRAYEYVQLYGLYTECEAIYQVDNLLAIWETLDARPYVGYLKSKLGEIYGLTPAPAAA